MAKKDSIIDRNTQVASPKKVATPTQTNVSDLYSKAWRNSYDKEQSRKKPTIFELVQHRVLPGGKKKYQAEVFFRAEEMIYDETTGNRRLMRYNRRESSIWADEQSKGAKPEIVRFDKGMLVAMPNDPALLAYLRKSNLNKSNEERDSSKPPKFFEINAKKAAVKSIEQEMAALDAISLALRAPLEKIIPIAKYLNINTNTSIDEIRYSLKAMANNNPTSFIKLFDNKEAIFKGTCKTAIEYGILKVSSTDIMWETGAKIMGIPLGQDPFDALVTYLKDKNMFAQFNSDLENKLNAIIGK